MNITQSIDNLVTRLKHDQTEQGSWEYPFETGITTDAYMIILLRSLEIDDEQLIEELAERIMSRQEQNGAWKLFHDELDGNISATIDSYYALLYSRYYQKNDARLRAARRFILNNGGMEKANMFTKMMLTLTGQQRWPAFFPLPIEFILLPSSFPINFYSLSVYGRSNIAPIMILADKRFRLKTKNRPDLRELYGNREDAFFSWSRSNEWQQVFSAIKNSLTYLAGLPAQLHSMAVSQTKQYILGRIEEDGTFYSYFSSTFFMIYAMISLGHSKNDPIIQNAINGLKSMRTAIKGTTHMQYTTASIWNTSLISHALQEAGVSSHDPIIAKANNFLLKKQHRKYGDWAVHNPQSLPGGWGFSNINTINPDVDDSTATLRAITAEATDHSPLLYAWDKGTNWVTSMQNDDGGWPAFEKNTDSRFFSFLPIEKGEFILTDPSSADLTGRTLEYLGKYTNMGKTLAPMKDGIRWLVSNQESNGSWYGRWGICYIYGTWAALTGLAAAGVSPKHKAIEKGKSWLKKIQNADGGWGESCKSDSNMIYTPLGTSTLTHTAWAADALLSISDHPTLEIKKAISFLIQNLDQDDWTTDYPHGQGMAGELYIHYHSYRYIFPLLALAHYKNKWGEGNS
ncbi:squalene--hopene cyclase [Cytobacillus gottheilii]|uniref:terpene cyclase/mutase family protein n=1 Tax=Cytobacillus gottheilii TaxID=859144 RepID=UPI003CF3F1FA